MTLREKLLAIQCELNVPKNQRNKFGNYNYRSCEDILEALKPLLKKYKVLLTIDDSIEHIGDRYYVEAEAKVRDIEKKGVISVFAYAREDKVRSGMAEAQITGATSSYARKYALNGLFAIDDTKDPDSTNKHEKALSTKSLETGMDKVVETYGKCDVCGAKGKYHKAGCPNGGGK